MYKCLTPNPIHSSGVSPSPTTLLERYNSPPTGTFRRRLFVDTFDGEPGVTSTGTTSATSTAPTTVTKTDQAGLVPAIPAGQTVVTMATANGQTVAIPVQGKAEDIQLVLKQQQR